LLALNLFTQGQVKLQKTLHHEPQHVLFTFGIGEPFLRIDLKLRLAYTHFEQMTRAVRFIPCRNQKRAGISINSRRIEQYQILFARH